MATIAVLGTLDSKGFEHEYVANIIRKRGHKVKFIDLGTGGPAQIQPDYSRFDVAESAGLNLQEFMDRKDRGECVVAMSKAAPVFLAKLVEDKVIDGVISLGGGGGTALATSAMRALPIGFPKLMVSTLASGNTEHYLGTKDIAMMPSIVDVAGLNSISKMIFSRAAGSICGMVEAEIEANENSKPLIVASMFGNTTECINIASKVLEDAGYEVLVFHATGTGGRTMEDLINTGMVTGVLDVTTTEWADELLGATLSAGPTRLDAMTKAKVPAVVAPGCLDMANYGELETLPEEFKDRNIYIHNPQVTLLRTNADECAKLGEILAEKSNANSAPTSILLPTKGISVICQEGQSFYDKEADDALFDAIRANAEVEVLDYEVDINSEVFAKAAAHKLLELINN
ncbi:Tm-1-like ATP-binding domain-containing protein [Lentisphaera marina]|uniref:Tm-1-like ATP-binding domain-containing protein n=1 Tax=Lentisphaera marina TaxID=1111041 RepID=UPI002365BB07|nr:Tm-1-like ATP-binding domain-containing protein [Lentisphaera marina]MDD7984894.1 Tm-1-like ATP-binding domain-containing protein [Lentisphaera marina]